MKKQQPSVTKLNAVIYNKYVKVFNDASNDPALKEFRSQIVAARKRFPTYSELLSMDLMHTYCPTFTDIDGNLRHVKSWVSTDATEPCDGFFDASFDKVDYMYAVGVAFQDDAVVFGLKGTHTFDIKGQ